MWGLCYDAFFAFEKGPARIETSGPLTIGRPIRALRVILGSFCLQKKPREESEETANNVL